MALSEWQKFFLIRFPLAALAIGLALEVPAYLLSGVTLHRDTVDDVASAVLHDKHPYRVVLIGDSVTHNVALKFRIGDAGEVADLTTHARAGLPSSLFLLRRYLENGNRPQIVVLAATRNIFVLPMSKETFELYVTSVFTLPGEREFLQKYYADYVDYRWKPAALSIQTKVADPLFSLIRHPRDEIWVPPDMPSPDPKLEQYPNLPADPAAFRAQVDIPFDVRPEARAVLTEICNLSQRYGFELDLVWPPMESRVRSVLEANGSLQHVNEQLAQLFAESHTHVAIVDSSTTRTYPYFDRELTHIRGSGWEQVYAAQLISYIHEFETGVPQRVTALK
jgi:hypothetical protein